LGRELRQLRERSGLSVAQVAAALGWSVSKVNRIENARIAVSASDVSDACDLYGSSADSKAGLVRLAREAGQKGWWTAYSDVLSGTYVTLEAEATRIRTWEPLLIPGLLQSEAYARAILEAGRYVLNEGDMRRKVDARMARKITLLGSTAPRLHALIDEVALRRPVGPPDVMREQLDELLRVAEWQNVTVQVVPFSAAPHSGLDGAFSLLSFLPEDPDIAYLSCLGGDLYVEAADQVKLLELAFERLAELALTPGETSALIAEVRSEHEPEHR
jgi:transcriptional regulator with XRE-family HTH domain